jgi:hypothetical protein
MERKEEHGKNNHTHISIHRDVRSNWLSTLDLNIQNGKTTHPPASIQLEEREKKKKRIFLEHINLSSQEKANLISYMLIIMLKQKKRDK